MQSGTGTPWLTSRSRARLARTGRYDVVIVPGALVYPDGSPSPTLRRRVSAAVWMAQADYAGCVLISGRGNGPRTEAQVGQDIARELGLSPSRIETEDASGRTAENARFTADRVGERSAVVVTDAWHAPRTRLWFRRYLPGCEVLAIPTPVATWARQGPREGVKWALQLWEARRD